MTFDREISGIYRLKVPFMSVYTSVFLVQFDGKNLLIDCGTDASDVDNYIIPALKELRLTLDDINYLIVTHNHEDHAGGKGRILECNQKIQVVGDNNIEFSREIKIYPLIGHTQDFLGVLDLRSGTLISGDGLQGAGIGKFRCSLENKEEYIKSIEKIQADERIQNILFSHAYEPWYKNGAFGRNEVEQILLDCKKYAKGI